MVEENRSINHYNVMGYGSKDRDNFIKNLMNSNLNIWEDIPKDAEIAADYTFFPGNLGESTGFLPTSKRAISNDLAEPLAAKMYPKAIDSLFKRASPEDVGAVEELLGGKLTQQGLFDSILGHEGRHLRVHDRSPFTYPADYVQKYFNTDMDNPLSLYFDKNVDHMERVVRNYAKNYPSSHARSVRSLTDFDLLGPDTLPALYDEAATRVGDWGDPIRNTFFVESPKDKQMLENYLRTLHNYWGD
jgi:hypothetical protein